MGRAGRDHSQSFPAAAAALCKQVAQGRWLPGATTQGSPRALATPGNQDSSR